MDSHGQLCVECESSVEPFVNSAHGIYIDCRGGRIAFSGLLEYTRESTVHSAERVADFGVGGMVERCWKDFGWVEILE